MIATINRPPHDEFTFDLFNELVEGLPNTEAYYLWTNPPSTLENFVETATFSEPNVVLGIKDTLEYYDTFNFWQPEPISGAKELIKLSMKWPETNFVVFTSMENLILDGISNVQIIPWGGDITNQASLYPTVEPVLDKNPDSPYTFVSLNRNKRFHRVVLLSYLYGSGCDSRGIITFLQPDKLIGDTFMSEIPWEFEPWQYDARDQMIIGYERILQGTPHSDDYRIYGGGVGTNDNVTNFETALRQKYREAVAEIATETVFSSPAYLVTEKTLNTFLGCNFPIILGGCGIIEHLRWLGFDMFDDIIDHSYDTMPNPVDRILAAMDANRRILTHGAQTRALWRASRDRFLSNVEVSRRIYDKYRSRAVERFGKIVWK